MIQRGGSFLTEPSSAEKQRYPRICLAPRITTIAVRLSGSKTRVRYRQQSLMFTTKGFQSVTKRCEPESGMTYVKQALANPYNVEPVYSSAIDPRLWPPRKAVAAGYMFSFSRAKRPRRPCSPLPCNGVASGGYSSFRGFDRYGCLPASLLRAILGSYLTPRLDWTGPLQSGKEDLVDLAGAAAHGGVAPQADYADGIRRGLERRNRSRIERRNRSRLETIVVLS